MTQRERQILQLIEAEPMISQLAIAEKLGIGESNVKMTLLRSRRQLKALLEKEGVCL